MTLAREGSMPIAQASLQPLALMPILGASAHTYSPTERQWFWSELAWRKFPLCPLTWTWTWGKFLKLAECQFLYLCNG